MQFTTATIIAASAFFSALTSASPIISQLLAAPQNITSTLDKAIQELENSGQIAWAAAGAGHYVEIAEETWNTVLNTIQARDGSSSPASASAVSTLETRGQKITDVGPYTATVNCEGGGALMYKKSILDSAVNACQRLLGSDAGGPLQLNKLRIYQTPQMVDANGIAAYVRFSVKLLAAGAVYSPFLCEQAMAKFDVICQKGEEAKTHGGEITVGKFIMFNADPTDYDCNC